jgi:replicative DNA helicase
VSTPKHSRQSLDVMDVGLPQNLEAERYVLSSILLKENTLETVSSHLSEESFSVQPHRIIWRRMKELQEDGEPIDRVTLANALIRYGELKAVGGVSYLAGLDEGIPSSVNLPAYARIVQDKAMLRRIIYTAKKTIDRSLAQQDAVKDILFDASQDIARMESDAELGHRPRTPLEVIENHEGGVSGFLEGKREPGLPTGLPSLDNILGGLEPQATYLLGGRTSSGKSSLALQISMNLAKQGVPGVFFSLEMSAEQLVSRAACAQAEVPLRSYRSSSLLPEQRREFVKAVTEISELPLYIDDHPGMTLSELITSVNKIVLDKKVKFAVLDYVQIMDSKSDRNLKFRDQTEFVTYASRVVRLLARKHNLIFFLLSQLSRPADKRRGGEDRPGLSEFRDSGALENDAYAAMAVYRPEQNNPGRRELFGLAEVIVLKNRNGETGTAHMEFQGRYTKFKDTGTRRDDE